MRGTIPHIYLYYIYKDKCSKVCKRETTTDFQEWRRTRRIE